MFVLLGLNAIRYIVATSPIIVMRKEPQQFCSFFDNRAPKVQPGLKNCTWFKDNSCCGQEEIDATFGRVKPLRGASQACQKYTNYLMCYICAPNQNIFYFRERLTVCHEFCDAWYRACKTAILKGSIMGDLFANGDDFCTSCRFQVSQREKNDCFFFDVRLDTTSGTTSLHGFPMFLVECLVLLSGTLLWH